MKRQSVGIAAAASIAALVLPPLGAPGSPPALATHLPACPVTLNYYAMQYANSGYNDGYKGQFGWMYTFVPGVPNYENVFSLSHLYSFTPPNPGQGLFQYSGWFVEVGWYKGAGAPPPNGITAFPYPRYYTAKADSTTPYTEIDYEEAPRDVHIPYELQYVGYNYEANRYKWSVYTNDLNAPRHTWNHANMAVGVPTSGGEVSGNAQAGTQMRVDVVPNHQLKEADGSWHNWTPSYMSSQGATTAACDDSNFTFTWDAQYQDFRVSGDR